LARIIAPFSNVTDPNIITFVCILSILDILIRSKYESIHVKKWLNPAFILSFKLESAFLFSKNENASVNENSKSFDEKLNARGVVDKFVSEANFAIDCRRIYKERNLENLRNIVHL
jgi:hypothetical protein